MAALFLPKKVHYVYACYYTSMTSDLEGVGILTVVQQMHGAFEASSSLGNSFLSHNYPAVILSTAVLCLVLKPGEKKYIYIRA